GELLLSLVKDVYTRPEADSDAWEVTFDLEDTLVIERAGIDGEHMHEAAVWVGHNDRCAGLIGEREVACAGEVVACLEVDTAPICELRPRRECARRGRHQS